VKQFEASALLWVVTGILRDIARNLLHSLVPRAGLRGGNGENRPGPPVMKFVSNKILV